MSFLSCWIQAIHTNRHIAEFPSFVWVGSVTPRHQFNKLLDQKYERLPRSLFVVVRIAAVVVIANTAIFFMGDVGRGGRPHLKWKIFSSKVPRNISVDLGVILTTRWPQVNLGRFSIFFCKKFFDQIPHRTPHPHPFFVEEKNLPQFFVGNCICNGRNTWSHFKNK